MKKFLLRLIAIFCLFIIILFVFFVTVDSLGMSDEYYKRFTTKGEHSLIVGPSRAAQGIVPSVINEMLYDSEYDLPIYNFSFTVGKSPYGEIYYNSIKEKLGINNDHNSLFIVAVDPLALAVENNDTPHFREENQILDKIRHYYRPQIKYLFLYCRHQRFNMRHLKLHDDGWLEVFGIDMDSLSIEEHVREKIADYDTLVFTPSPYRIMWLKEIINLFKANGTVYLCRIPLSNQLLQWENVNWPSFEEDMESVSEELSVQYFSFVNENCKYHTIDGNHLFRNDAVRFTQTLCDSIKSSLIKYQ